MNQPPIPPTYTMQDAERLGYQSITTTYSRGSTIELEYLTNVLIDMIGIDHCLIETRGGLEVGRPKQHLL
jgi:hypothetical protein